MLESLMILECLLSATPWKKSYDQIRQHIKNQRHHFANKGPSSHGPWFFQWSCMDVRVGL